MAYLEYDMSDFLQQCCDKHVELAGTRSKPLRPAATPFLEENAKDDEEEDNITPQSPQGALADMAVRVLMKLLYAARVARYDLLRSIAGLARRLHGGLNAVTANSTA